MAVPDETYFGKNENGDGINYGDVRKETDPDKIIQLLNFRLNDILINQVNELHAEPDGQRKVLRTFLRPHFLNIALLEPIVTFWELTVFPDFPLR